MKKFLIFLIGFVFLNTAVFSQTPEENFQRAKKEELAKIEKILLEKKVEIERFTDEIVKDRIISGKEMRILRKMIKEFDELKKNSNRRLCIYNIETKTDISEATRKILKVYFSENFNYGDNEKEDVRRFFIKKTGQDVIIKKSKNLTLRFLGGFLSGLFAVLILFIIFIILCGVTGIDDKPIPIISSLIFVFILVIFIFLFC